jgi:osmotically-inducible protein OsmY
MADETVKAAEINVDVKDKIVTLSGSVDTQAVKDQAVSVARATDGVTEVIDKITIQEHGYGSGSEHGREMMGRENREGRDH